MIANGKCIEESRLRSGADLRRVKAGEAVRLRAGQAHLGMPGVPAVREAG